MRIILLVLFIALMQSVIASDAGSSRPFDGAWTSGDWTFNVMGQYAVPVIKESGFAGAVVEMVYDGDEVSITYIDGPLSCGDIVGRYRYSLEEDTLSFTLIGDSCEGRMRVLLNGDFTRVLPPVSK